MEPDNKNYPHEENLEVNLEKKSLFKRIIIFLSKNSLILIALFFWFTWVFRVDDETMYVSYWVIGLISLIFTILYAIFFRKTNAKIQQQIDGLEMQYYLIQEIRSISTFKHNTVGILLLAVDNLHTNTISEVQREFLYDFKEAIIDLYDEKGLGAELFEEIESFSKYYGNYSFFQMFLKQFFNVQQQNGTNNQGDRQLAISLEEGAATKKHIEEFYKLKGKKRRNMFIFSIVAATTIAWFWQHIKIFESPIHILIFFGLCFIYFGAMLLSTRMSIKNNLMEEI